MKIPQKAVPSKEFLHQKYVVEGLSSREIAAQIYSSRQMVTQYLKRHEIPLKNVTRRQTGKKVFGFRQYAGKAIAVKKEADVIEVIKSYRKSGYSYKKIADTLNEHKLQTKEKKGVWYSKVVRKIYLRNCLEMQV